VILIFGNNSLALSIFLRISSSDDLLKSYRRELYHVDQDEIDMISSALSTIGWSSAYDIAEATGIPFLRVTRVVTTMPDVVIASNGSTRSYRKTL
jgi:hypothetical protein